MKRGDGTGWETPLNHPMWGTVHHPNTAKIDRQMQIIDYEWKLKQKYYGWLIKKYDNFLSKNYMFNGVSWTIRSENQNAELPSSLGLEELDVLEKRFPNIGNLKANQAPQPSGQQRSTADSVIDFMNKQGYRHKPKSMTFTDLDGNEINLFRTVPNVELKLAWQRANGKEWPYEKPDQLIAALMQDFLLQRGYQSQPSNPFLFTKNANNATTTNRHSTNALITLNLEDEFGNDPILATEWKELYGFDYTNGEVRLRKRRRIEIELATLIGDVINEFQLPPFLTNIK